MNDQIYTIFCLAIPDFPILWKYWKIINKSLKSDYVIQRVTPIWGNNISFLTTKESDLIFKWGLEGYALNGSVLPSEKEYLFHIAEIVGNETLIDIAKNDV